jgi:hypothetical protein
MPSLVKINDQVTQVIPIIPGSKSVFDLSISSQKALNFPRIDSIMFDVNYPNTLLSIDTIVSLQSNWTASIVQQDAILGTLKILARCQTPTKELPNKGLLRLLGSTYLGDPNNQQLKINASVNALCIDPSQSQVGFTLDAVCFAQGRLISAMKDAFTIDVSEKELRFSMPFTGVSEAYVVDIAGRVIPLLSLQERSSGYHHAMLPDLSQGVYMIIAKNGPYQVQKQIIIHNTSILH